MEVWIMILTIISADMKEVHTSLNFANSPQYNTEQSCKDAAQSMASQAQIKLGTNNYKIFWQCQPVTEQEFEKALPPRI